MDAGSVEARLLLLKNPFDKSALGEPVELWNATESLLSTGVVFDSKIALVEIEWEGGKAETLKTCARDDVAVL